MVGTFEKTSEWMMPSIWIKRNNGNTTDTVDVLGSMTIEWTWCHCITLGGKSWFHGLGEKTCKGSRTWVWWWSWIMSNLRPQITQLVSCRQTKVAIWTVKWFALKWHLFYVWSTYQHSIKSWWFLPVLIGHNGFSFWISEGSLLHMVEWADVIFCESKFATSLRLMCDSWVFGSHVKEVFLFKSLPLVSSHLVVHAPVIVNLSNWILRIVRCCCHFKVFFIY